MTKEDQLDRLLERAVNQPSVPTGLIDRIERRIHSRRRSRQGFVVGLMLLFVAAGLYLQTWHRSTPSAVMPTPTIERLATAGPTQVEIGKGFLAELVQTSHPNVTIVRVHERYVEPSPEPTSLAPDARDQDSTET